MGFLEWHRCGQPGGMTLEGQGGKPWMTRVSRMPGEALGLPGGVPWGLEGIGLPLVWGMTQLGGKQGPEGSDSSEERLLRVA